MIKLCVIFHISQIICYSDVVALIIIIDIGLHLKQINNSLKFIFFADGQLGDNGILAKSRPDLLHSAVEISSHDIHLINECHTGNIVSVSLTPYVFRLGLYTALCTENAHCAVQYTKGTLYLHSKVNVSGCINDIDTMLKSIRHGFGFFFQGPMAGRSR